MILSTIRPIITMPIPTKIGASGSAACMFGSSADCHTTPAGLKYLATRITVAEQ